MNQTQIVILDFGSQYTQVLARRARDAEVQTEVVAHTISAVELKKQYPFLKGIIFSGGPASVYAFDSLVVDKDIYQLNLPILGVCYGMQLIAMDFGGKAELAKQQEFGKSEIEIIEKSLLFENITTKTQVWMSHADHVVQLPEGFKITSQSENSVSSFENTSKHIYGIQFHTEVSHTIQGQQILENFLFKICQCTKTWKMTEFIANKIIEIKALVGDKRVVLGLSGGVDSSVAAALISKAIGKQLTCIFVDTGLLRKDEAKKVMHLYNENFDLNIILVDASETFFANLKTVIDPEQKRKIIGKTFIDIFEKETKKINDAIFLAQGTIYSDVIESNKASDSSKTIKSHHNVGGLPEEMKLSLLEPLKELFKDEVRKVGLELGLPKDIVYRHPFPGPGLGIRIIGEVTRQKADVLREADDIFIQMLHEYQLYDKCSQANVILTPIKTTGVMGDNRTYDNLVSLRCVDSLDFMTASFTRLPWDFLDKVATSIINGVEGVNRVVYDITSKPPGTIEWE